MDDLIKAFPLTPCPVHRQWTGLLDSRPGCWLDGEERGSIVSMSAYDAPEDSATATKYHRRIHVLCYVIVCINYPF